MADSLIISIVLFISALIHGLLGFAFALTALPLIALVLSMKEAVPLMALYSLVVNIFMLLLLKEKKIFKIPLCFFLALFVGILLGIRGFLVASEFMLRFILFLAILFFIIWEIYKMKRDSQTNYKTEIEEELFKHPYALGSAFIAGLLAGLLNTPGPPLIILLFHFKLNKNIFKATLQFILAFSAFSAVLNHLMVGNITLPILKLYFFNLPLVLIGLLLGQRLYSHLSNRVYYYLVNLMLFISGILLLLKSHH